MDATTTPGGGYPVRFDVQYPDRSLNRVSTAFRLIAAIPIVIVAGAVGGHQEWYASDGRTWSFGLGAGGALFLGPLLMLVFRQKYPRWWFDWNRELANFTNRVCVFLALMDDRYPSTDEHQAVELDFAYPDAKGDLNRWLPLVKWFLAIPHYIVLVFLWIGALVAVVVSWFAILFTGRYPRPLFDFAVGVLRWTNRVAAYAFLLVTDRYPPFRLAA
jgi:hypothetical protein